MQITPQAHMLHTHRRTRNLCIAFCLGLFTLGAAWQAGTAWADTATPNASTDPNQPSMSEVVGTTSGNNTSATGNAANCAPVAGQPCEAGAGNPINVMTGNKYQREADMPALPGLMGIEIVRHYNSLHMGLGQIGYGWRLSYETTLTFSQRSIHITHADGSQTIFNRSVFNPSDCACQDPAQGHVMIYHTAQGDEYTWFMTDGKQLHFNRLGKLERMTAPTGESVHLTRGLKGELLKVTDPQGRSLVMHYADKHAAGFKGIVAIDTPVGRFNYQHNNDTKSPGISNLIAVKYPADKNIQDDKPSATFTKTYHYGEAAYINAHMLPANTQRPQIPQAGHLLTGISINAPSTAQANTARASLTHTTTQRLRTWMYDQYGRGILSVHGTPNSKEATQAVKVSYRVVPLKQEAGSTKIKPYPRITHHGQIGQTILTNSLGQTTTYNYTLIAGQYRLLQILGAGCSECAEPNIVYGYDKLGRQTEVTKVSQTNLSTSSKTSSKNQPIYQALTTTRTDYDASGRVLQISKIAYQHGKPQPAKLQVRYVYPNTPSFPQLKQAKRAATEPIQIFSQPSLIATPSVVAGKEHQWLITYNQVGQPTQVTETGYRPVLPADKGALPVTISRTTTYTYTTINGRSLLTQIDAPLPNGSTNTPKDSDITQYQYDKHGQYLTQITAPNNVITQMEYDTTSNAEAGSTAMGGTGRVVQTTANNGIATQFTYNAAGKILSTQRYPASMSLAAAKAAGLSQKTAMAYDVFGNTTMVQRADGQAVAMEYSFDGKLTQLRDGLGNRVEWKDWTKDQQDKTQTVSTQQWFTADAPDTVARAWYFWHDDQQRLTQRLSPDGGLDTWRYSDDQAGDTQTSNSDKLFQPVLAQTHWVQHIDPLNRMTLSAVNNQAAAQIRITPAGYVDASFKHHADAGAVKQTTTIAAQPTQIVDDFGRVIQYSSPQHGTSTAVYDAANRIAEMRQADGTKMDCRYDVAGRILSKTATPATQSITKESIQYTYNAFGLKQIQDTHQTITYTQDALGREIDKATTLKLATGKQTTYHIRTRYNAQGRIKAKQLIDGQWLVFTLDDKTGLTTAMRLHNTIWPSLTNQLATWLNLPDLPLQIATKETVVADISVHPFNGITHLTHGNGISDDYAFDLAGRLTTVSHGTHPQHSKASRRLIKANYTYDAGRRLISEQTSTTQWQGKVNTYAYSGWNQLATAPTSGLIKAVANTANTQQLRADLTPERFTYPESTDITHDQAGRTTRDTYYRYTYNVWGKLNTVQTNTNNKPPETIASYQSNALGERIMASCPQSDNNQTKTSKAQTRYYLYDHQQRIAELDENGNILQQYLYINQTPVAVINTPTDQATDSTASNPTGIIAIHADRRHAPIAATDEQGKVIWQTEYDAWGKVINVNNNGLENTAHGERVESQNGFNLNLRLPGQWQDQATGLHYNYQRDYNPDSGRYLTPDPLGFPDGADPYAYVNNDPLNKLDPLGLYEIDVHYYMTYFLGVMAGLSEYQAHVVALGAQYVDDNPFTQPLPHSLTQAAINIALENPDVVNRLESYHFTQYGYDPANPNPNNTNFGSRDDDPQYVRDRIEKPSNPQLTRLLTAANTNYKGAPCKTIKEQLFGEYLHAFEDTFGHRDQLNAPISINGGFGHGSYLHEPDKTYNDTSQTPTSAFGYWYTREARSLEMEKEVFTQIQKNFGAQGTSKTTNQKITIDDIMATLEKFNKIHETEDTTNSLFTGSEKLKLLNDFLTKNGFRNIPTYNVTQACKFRQNTMAEIAGNPPAGVILATPLNCPAARG